MPYLSPEWKETLDLNITEGGSLSKEQYRKLDICNCLGISYGVKSQQIIENITEVKDQLCKHLSISPTNDLNIICEEIARQIRKNHTWRHEETDEKVFTEY